MEKFLTKFWEWGSGPRLFPCQSRYTPLLFHVKQTYGGLAESDNCGGLVKFSERGPEHFVGFDGFDVFQMWRSGVSTLLSLSTLSLMFSL